MKAFKIILVISALSTFFLCFNGIKGLIDLIKGLINSIKLSIDSGIDLDIDLADILLNLMANMFLHFGLGVIFFYLIPEKKENVQIENESKQIKEVSEQKDLIDSTWTCSICGSVIEDSTLLCPDCGTRRKNDK